MEPVNRLPRGGGGLSEIYGGGGIVWGERARDRCGSATGRVRSTIGRERGSEPANGRAAGHGSDERMRDRARLIPSTLMIYRRSACDVSSRRKRLTTRMCPTLIINKYPISVRVPVRFDVCFHRPS